MHQCWRRTSIGSIFPSTLRTALAFFKCALRPSIVLFPSLQVVNKKIYYLSTVRVGGVISGRNVSVSLICSRPIGWLLLLLCSWVYFVYFVSVLYIILYSILGILCIYTCRQGFIFLQMSITCALWSLEEAMRNCNGRRSCFALLLSYDVRERQTLLPQIRDVS